MVNQWPTRTNNLFNNLLLYQFQPLYMLLLVYQLIYPKVLFTNRRMEENLETHQEGVHMEEICMEDHLSIHLLDPLDSQHMTHVCLYHHGINHLLCNLYQN
jgi:hypothetical protein